MLHTLAVVELAAGSRSASARRFGGGSLLEWIVRRVSESARITGVIVVSPAGPIGAEAKRLVPPDIPVACRPEPDALGRLVAALEEYRADAIVRVADDHPFVDPSLVDELIAAADRKANVDGVGFLSREGLPASQLAVGLFADWCRVSALRRTERFARHPDERDNYVRYMHRHPELFSLATLPVPAELDRPDLRMRLALDEDWEHAESIVEALGAERLEWRQIAGFLHDQPRMRLRMADLNRARSG